MGKTTTYTRSVNRKLSLVLCHAREFLDQTSPSESSFDCCSSLVVHDILSLSILYLFSNLGVFTNIHLLLIHTFFQGRTHQPHRKTSKVCSLEVSWCNCFRFSIPISPSNTLYSLTEHPLLLTFFCVFFLSLSSNSSIERPVTYLLPSLSLSYQIVLGSLISNCPRFGCVVCFTF